MKKEKIKVIVEIVLFIGALMGITYVYYFSGNTVEVEDEEAEVKLVQITDANFEEEVLQSDKPVILEFSSNSCPPCITMVSTMIHIAKENEDIKVGMVNSDGNTSNLFSEYEIEAYPTIILFQNGEVKKVFVGVTSEENLLKEFK